MDPHPTTLDDLRIVTDFFAGASGEEARGGPKDGELAPFLVIAQIEVARPQAIAADGSATDVEVLHLGLTRDAAITLARQLVKAANLLPNA